MRRGFIGTLVAMAVWPSAASDAPTPVADDPQETWRIDAPSQQFVISRAGRTVAHLPAENFLKSVTWVCKTPSRYVLLAQTNANPDWLVVLDRQLRMASGPALVDSAVFSRDCGLVAAVAFHTPGAEVQNLPSFGVIRVSQVALQHDTQRRARAWFNIMAVNLGDHFGPALLRSRDVGKLQKQDVGRVRASYDGDIWRLQLRGAHHWSTPPQGEQDAVLGTVCARGEALTPCP